MLHRPLLLLIASAALAVAQDTPAEPPKPSIKQLDENKFQIGEITFDKISREIRFPAKIQMSEGLLEFLIVHDNGKIHESLMATAASPTHLNLAFTLLRYLPSRELYFVPTHAGETPPPPVVISEKEKAGSRIAIDVEWQENEKTQRASVNEWIQHSVTAEAMPAGPWVYGASETYEGKYIPEVTGDIAAIFLSNAAIINFPGADNGNDDVWNPFPKRIPADGTAVTVIISPYQNSKPTPKP